MMAFSRAEHTSCKIFKADVIAETPFTGTYQPVNETKNLTTYGTGPKRRQLPYFSEGGKK
jgi:hypothetical protein